jgi:hypothetical protein
MKKCKSCKTEIPNDAKKCGHCSTDQRGWAKRHPILTALLAIIILFIVISIIGSENSSQKVGSNNATSQSNGDTQQKNTTYKVGDKIKMGDVILTVNKIETSQGGDYTKPSEGNQWIDLNLTIENTGSTQQFVTTLGQMYVLDEKNNQFQIAVTDKAMQNPGMGLDGAIIAKAKKTGWVGFEVLKMAKGLKFQYNASFFDNKNILVDLGM